MIEIRRYLREDGQQLLGLCAGFARMRGHREKREEVEANIREAIAFHVDGLRQENEPVPEPTVWTGLVEV